MNSSTPQDILTFGVNAILVTMFCKSIATKSGLKLKIRSSTSEVRKMLVENLSKCALTTDTTDPKCVQKCVPINITEPTSL